MTPCGSFSLTLASPIRCFQRSCSAQHVFGCGRHNLPVLAYMYSCSWNEVSDEAMNNQHVGDLYIFFDRSDHEVASASWERGSANNVHSGLP